MKTERMLFQEKMRSRLSAGQYEMITDGLCGFEETNHKTDNRLMHIGLLSLQESAAFVILYSHFIVKIESSRELKQKPNQCHLAEPFFYGAYLRNVTLIIVRRFKNKRKLLHDRVQGDTL